MIGNDSTSANKYYFSKSKKLSTSRLSQKKDEKYDQVPGFWLLRRLEPRGDSRWLYRGIICQSYIILIWFCCQLQCQLCSHLVNNAQVILDTKWDFSLTIWKSWKYIKKIIHINYSTYTYIECSVINTGCTVKLLYTIRDHRPL